MTIRCDNGPEYISSTLATWVEKLGIQTSFIQPEQPQQNVYIERYNRTVGYAWLARYLFESVADGSGVCDAMALTNARTQRSVASPRSRNWPLRLSFQV